VIQTSETHIHGFHGLKCQVEIENLLDGIKEFSASADPIEDYSCNLISMELTGLIST